MTMPISTSSVSRAALRCALLAAFAIGASSAQAQNAVRGKQLYENTNNAPISCGFGICHGPDPRINTNKIRDGVDPARILRGITNVPEMRFLSVYVSAQDAADIAAYIANPNSASGAAVTASSTAMTFGSTQVGGTSTNSTPASVTLTNTGAGTLTITAIARSGTNATEFTAGGTCASASPVNLAPGATCTLTASFRPTATGTRSASLVVQSNAPTNPSISLTGLGSATATPDFTRSAPSIAFNAQTVATTSAAQTITLTSSGMAPLTITQVSATPTPEFAATSNCVGTLAAGASCTISVTFTPPAAGTRSGSVAITSNVAGSPHTITVAGIAVTSPTPLASLTNNSLVFGNQALSAPAPTPQGADFRNSGNAALQIMGVAISGANAADFRFSSGHTCAAGTLSPNGSCRIEVEFRPQSAGAKTANVTVTHNASGGATTLAVSGGASSAPISPDSVGGSALAPSNVGGAGGIDLWQLGLLGTLLLLARPVRRRLARR